MRHTQSEAYTPSNTKRDTWSATAVVCESPSCVSVRFQTGGLILQGCMGQMLTYIWRYNVCLNKINIILHTWVGVQHIDHFNKERFNYNLKCTIYCYWLRTLYCLDNVSRCSVGTCWVCVKYCLHGALCCVSGVTTLQQDLKFSPLLFRGEWHFWTLLSHRCRWDQRQSGFYVRWHGPALCEPVIRYKNWRCRVLQWLHWVRIAWFLFQFFSHL